MPNSYRVYNNARLQFYMKTRVHFSSIRRYMQEKKALFMFETGSIKKEKGAIWPFKGYTIPLWQ